MKITTKQIRNLYKKHNLKVGHTWYLDCKKICPLGLLHKELNNRGSAFYWAYKKYGKRWCQGFTCGFDGVPKEEIAELYYKSSNFMDGYRNGKIIKRYLL